MGQQLLLLRDIGLRYYRSTEHDMGGGNKKGLERMACT
jgi:hypothetical protein